MQVEDRTECRESGAVSYKRDVANVLALEVDPAAATNKEELDVHKVCPPMAQVASATCLYMRSVLLGAPIMSLFWRRAAQVQESAYSFVRVF
jgi:hypothetical protein